MNIYSLLKVASFQIHFFDHFKLYISPNDSKLIAHANSQNSYMRPVRKGVFKHLFYILLVCSLTQKSEKQKKLTKRLEKTCMICHKILEKLYVRLPIKINSLRAFQSVKFKKKFKYVKDYHGKT